MSDPLSLTLLLLVLASLVPFVKLLVGDAEALDRHAAVLVTSPRSNAG